MDLERIEALIEVIKDARVTELSVRRDGSAVVVRKPPGNGVYAPSKRGTGPQEDALPDSPAEETASPVGTIITAPMVGIFHMTDGVRSLGTHVKKGQVVGAIESMKLMNDVVSQMDGRVSEIYVEDGMPVEYGQALFRLDGV